MKTPKLSRESRRRLDAVNAARADRARAALADYTDGDLSIDISDALSDLMHLADRLTLDFDQLLATARLHHKAEVYGDDIALDTANHFHRTGRL